MLARYIPSERWSRQLWMFSTFIIELIMRNKRKIQCRYKIDAQKYKIAGIVNLANWRQITFKKGTIINRSSCRRSLILLWPVVHSNIHHHNKPYVSHAHQNHEISINRPYLKNLQEYSHKQVVCFILSGNLYAKKDSCL